MNSHQSQTFNAASAAQTPELLTALITSAQYLPEKQEEIDSLVEVISNLEASAEDIMSARSIVSAALLLQSQRVINSAEKLVEMRTAQKEKEDMTEKNIEQLGKLKQEIDLITSSQ